MFLISNISPRLINYDVNKTRKCIDNNKKAHSFIQCSRIKSSLFKAWLIKLMK